MEPIAQYEIPFLHPLVVHFPFVMLLLGFGAALLYLVLGRAAWRQAGLVLFSLGTAAAWAAAQTGQDLYRAVQGDPVVDAVVRYHQAGAEWTLAMGALAALVFAVVSLARVRVRWPRRAPEADGEAPEPAPPAPRREPLWGRVLAVVPAGLAAAAVAYTAHLGGVMVWGVPR